MIKHNSASIQHSITEKHEANLTELQALSQSLNQKISESRENAYAKSHLINHKTTLLREDKFLKSHNTLKIPGKQSIDKTSQDSSFKTDSEYQSSNEKSRSLPGFIKKSNSARALSQKSDAIELKPPEV